MIFAKFSHTKHEYIQGPEATKLNTVDVWLPNYKSSKDVWVVFIHGGAWRDPVIDSMTLKPALDILSESSFQKTIAGFASINYRLSPYPNHPTNPSSPDDPSRNAKHPDHLVDISKAVAFLEVNYGISSGFLLVGHSAGATLAFQILKQAKRFKIPAPAGILGVEGIYDIALLVNTYKSIPAYRELIESAFGISELAWKEASPALFEAPAGWDEVGIIIISHSDEDELVSKIQAEVMMKRLRQPASCKGKIHYLPAMGRHDEVWQKGHELARLIENALALL